MTGGAPRVMTPEERKMRKTAKEWMAAFFPTLAAREGLIRYAVYNHGTMVKIMIPGCDQRVTANGHVEDHYPDVELDFKNAVMHIQLLAPCNEITGGQILDRFIQMARAVGFQRIELIDISSVYLPRSKYGYAECKVSLPVLSILLRGQTWYQSKGFVSEEDPENDAWNQAVREQPLAAFLTQVSEAEHGHRVSRIRMAHYAQGTLDSENMREEIAALSHTQLEGALLEEVTARFPGVVPEMPAHTAIQRMVDTVNGQGDEGCAGPEFALLKRILDACERNAPDGMPLIRYEEDRVLRL